jgi:signal peptidase II
VRQLQRATALLFPLLALIAGDHATKYVAKSQLEGRAPHQVISFFLDLRYAENTDVAFNLLRWVPLSWRSVFLVVFGGCAVVALVVALFWRSGNQATTAALLFILAGALGNYLDRLTRGYVVDFIHVPHWPVFNLADIYVTAGIALFVWGSMRPRQAAVLSST